MGSVAASMVMATQLHTHGATRLGQTTSMRSQVFDTRDSLVVRAPKTTLLSIGNTNRSSPPQPLQKRAPSMPVIVPASSRDQFRHRRMSLPAMTSFPAAVALRRDATNAQLRSGESIQKAEVQTDSGRLRRRLSRGGNTPARSLMAEIQWEEAWRKLSLTGASGGSAQRPKAREVTEPLLRRSSYPAILFRRCASFCGFAVAEQTGVQDAARANGRGLVGRTAAYVLHRRGSM